MSMFAVIFVLDDEITGFFFHIEDAFLHFPFSHNDHVQLFY